MGVVPQYTDTGGMSNEVEFAASRLQSNIDSGDRRLAERIDRLEKFRDQWFQRLADDLETLTRNVSEETAGIHESVECAKKELQENIDAKDGEIRDFVQEEQMSVQDTMDAKYQSLTNKQDKLQEMQQKMHTEITPRADILSWNSQLKSRMGTNEAHSKDNDSRIDDLSKKYTTLHKMCSKIETQIKKQKGLLQNLKTSLDSLHSIIHDSKEEENTITQKLETLLDE